MPQVVAKPALSRRSPDFAATNVIGHDLRNGPRPIGPLSPDWAGEAQRRNLHIFRDPRSISDFHGKFRGDAEEEGQELDPRAAAEWARHFEVEHIPEQPSEAFLLELARRVLHDPVITPANVICTSSVVATPRARWSGSRSRT